MTSRRDRISQLSPEEYERAVVRSAKLASELAEAQNEEPSTEVAAILEKAKQPGAIAKERRSYTVVRVTENPSKRSGGGWSMRTSDGGSDRGVERKSGISRVGSTVNRNAASGRIVNRSAASGSLRKKS